MRWHLCQGYLATSEEGQSTLTPKRVCDYCEMEAWLPAFLLSVLASCTAEWKERQRREDAGCRAEGKKEEMIGSRYEFSLFWHWNGVQYSACLIMLWYSEGSVSCLKAPVRCHLLILLWCKISKGYPWLHLKQRIPRTQWSLDFMWSQRMLAFQTLLVTLSNCDLWHINPPVVLCPPSRYLGVSEIPVKAYFGANLLPFNLVT